MSKIQLDDLLNEKKGPAPVLDLFKISLSSRSDFESALAKVPEYKIRPEKVRPEEVTGEGPLGWRYVGGMKPPQQGYTDSLPETMRGINMNDFYQVDIDWRMLTTARPKTKLEEELFSRYVEMGRLQLDMQRREELNKNDTSSWKTIKTVPGRGAVTEVRITVCLECSDELCAGRCNDHLYNNYARQELETKTKGGGGASAPEGDEDEENSKKTKKKVKRKKGKSKKKEAKAVEESSDKAKEDEENKSD